MQDNIRSRELLKFLPEKPGRILDVGCGQGLLADDYRARGATEIVGIEIMPEKAKAATWKMDKVLCANVESMEMPYKTGYFDTIICSDILEHLFDPWDTLRKLAALLTQGGVLLATIPNAANYVVLLNLLSGSWSYTDWGLMDRTHLRFFTIDEIEKLFLSAGLFPEVLTYSVTPEAEQLIDRVNPDQIRFAVKAMFKALNPNLNPSQLDEMDPVFFYIYQYYMRGTKKFSEP